MPNRISFENTRLVFTPDAEPITSWLKDEVKMWATDNYQVDVKVEVVECPSDSHHADSLSDHGTRRWG